MTLAFPKFRLLDLSVALANNPHTDPPGLGPEIEYANHKQGLPEMLRMFPGLKAEDLPDGEAWGVERLRVTAHNGTHIDAPWHYASTQDRGRPAMTIDELPLEWCFKPGVKLDFRNLPDGYVATARDVADELGRVGHALKPLDIVVVNTAAGAKYGQPGYVDSGCGIGREATLYLLERGVRVVGTDAWSWDAPFSFTRKRFAESGDPRIIWEGHKAGRDIGYGQMEKLTNLDKLPGDGFWISCFPYKIDNGSAGFIRAVAFLDFGCITRGCGRSAPERPLSWLYRLEPAETVNPTSAKGQLSAENSSLDARPRAYNPIKSRIMSGRRAHLFEAAWHSRRRPPDPHKVAREPSAGRRMARSLQNSIAASSACSTR